MFFKTKANIVKIQTTWCQLVGCVWGRYGDHCRTIPAMQKIYSCSWIKITMGSSAISVLGPLTWAKRPYLFFAVDRLTCLLKGFQFNLSYRLFRRRQVPQTCVGTSVLVLLGCLGSACFPGTWTDSDNQHGKDRFHLNCSIMCKTACCLVLDMKFKLWTLIL